MARSIYYSSPKRSYQLDGKIQLSATFCKLYDCKNEPIHTIPYKLHQQYMPGSILVLLIQFMLLLPLRMLS